MSTVSPRIPFSTSSGNVNPVQDPDAFPPAQDLTAAEDAELHAQYLARLASERHAPADYHEAACVVCQAALSVPWGTVLPLCPCCHLPTADEYSERLSAELVASRAAYDRDVANKFEGYRMGLEHTRQKGLRGLIRKLVGA